MSLKLQLAEPKDLPRIVQIENESFADSPLTPILFPDGRSQESRNAYVETLGQQWHANTACRHVIVIDTDLDNKIIAFARWFIFIGEDVKFIKTDLKERDNAPGINEAAANEFFGGLLKLRLKLMGKKPHCRKSFPEAGGVGTDGPPSRPQRAVYRSSASATRSRDDASQVGM